MRLPLRHWVPLMFMACAGLGEHVAQALIGPDPASPPEGWPNLCSGHTIDVKPSVTSRQYTGTGSCWVNIAQNKEDVNAQAWVRAPVTFEGSYVMQSSTFRERLTFAIPYPTTGTASIPVVVSGTCSDDPWATGSQCTASPPNVNLNSSFGWALQPQSGPLSRNVFGAALISALLKKQASAPPLAPVDLDVVRWPAFDGAGNMGRVFWRAPDVSGNKWILSYDVEYAINSADSAFSNAGHVTGPGAKTSLSPNEVSRFYYTTFKLGGGDYFFRVCSVNDAGRQCTAPMKAREPTKAELMVVAHHQAGGALHAIGGPPSPATAPPPARVQMAPMAPVPR